MTPIDGAKIFIINRKINKILLVLRDNKPSIPSPNCWSLFGGGIEPGESPVEALKREISEEINIKVHDICQIDKIDVTLLVEDISYFVTGYIFLGYTDAELGSIEIYEGQKVEYFTFDEIMELKNLGPGALKNIQKYENLLRCEI